jgi:hypothetical protein
VSVTTNLEQVPLDDGGCLPAAVVQQVVVQELRQQGCPRRWAGQREGDSTDLPRHLQKERGGRGEESMRGAPVPPMQLIGR